MTGEEQENLFSRFKQATPRTHIKYGGSGLGLFISKSLTTLQGGAIGVFSQGEVGSTFAFYVATRTADPPPGLSADRAALKRSLPQRAISTENAMKAVKINVLIVEDNLVNQKVLRKQLLKFGWTVSVAGNGQEALDWLKGTIYWHGEEDGKKESSASGNGGPRDRPKAKDEVDIIMMGMSCP
jgi:CheY-like chemotaxis protein